MMPSFVLATQNPEKALELSVILAPYALTLTPLSQYTHISPEETGLTFVENALIKARFAAKISGKAALADDSGLVVPALGGAPGIYSARYAGPDASYTDNVSKLLEKMASLRGTEREAFFVCVLVSVLHEHDPLPLIAQGLCAGRITTKPQGQNGFGYDPIFWIESHHCTTASLSAEEKHRISHRGKALAQWIDKVNQTQELRHEAGRRHS